MGVEAPNASLQGRVSVLVAAGKCEAGIKNGFLSNDIKRTDLDGLSSPQLIERMTKLTNSNAADERRVQVYEPIRAWPFI